MARSAPGGPSSPRAAAAWARKATARSSKPAPEGSICTVSMASKNTSVARRSPYEANVEMSCQRATQPGSRRGPSAANHW